MMNRKIVALAAMFLCFAMRSASASSERLIDLGNGFAAERVSSIDVDDIWRAADVNILRSKAGLVVQFWPENEEFREKKGKWTAVGFLLSGMGDIGEAPVAIRLWSRDEVSYSPNQSKSYETRRGKVALFFHMGCPTITPCLGKILAVAVRLEAGSQVFINDKKVGTIDLIP